MNPPPLDLKHLAALLGKAVGDFLGLLVAHFADILKPLCELGLVAPIHLPTTTLEYTRDGHACACVRELTWGAT